MIWIRRCGISFMENYADEIAGNQLVMRSILRFTSDESCDVALPGEKRNHSWRVSGTRLMKLFDHFGLEKMPRISSSRIWVHLTQGQTIDGAEENAAYASKAGISSTQRNGITTILKGSLGAFFGYEVFQKVFISEELKVAKPSPSFERMAKTSRISTKIQRWWLGIRSRPISKQGLMRNRYDLDEPGARRTERR